MPRLFRTPAFNFHYTRKSPDLPTFFTEKGEFLFHLKARFTGTYRFPRGFSDRSRFTRPVSETLTAGKRRSKNRKQVPANQKTPKTGAESRQRFSAFSVRRQFPVSHRHALFLLPVNFHNLVRYFLTSDQLFSGSRISCSGL